MADMKIGKDVIELGKDKMLVSAAPCPSCGAATLLDSGIIEIPVRFTFIFKFNFTAKIRVQYDPSCGYFKILLNQ